MVAKRRCLGIDCVCSNLPLCIVTSGKSFTLLVSQLLLCEVGLSAASHPKSKFPAASMVLKRVLRVQSKC